MDDQGGDGDLAQPRPVVLMEGGLEELGGGPRRGRQALADGVLDGGRGDLVLMGGEPHLRLPGEPLRAVGLEGLEGGLQAGLGHSVRVEASEVAAGVAS